MAQADPFDARQLTGLLRHEIPLAAAMGIEVTACQAHGLQLRAPLAPNLNHKSTAFGGSLYSAAALACWTLLHALLAARDVRAQVVISAGEMTYDTPVTGDFSVHAAAPAAADLARALRVFGRHGKGRLPMAARVHCGSQQAARFAGTFVLVAADGH